MLGLYTMAWVRAGDPLRLGSLSAMTIAELGKEVTAGSAAAGMLRFGLGARKMRRVLRRDIECLGPPPLTIQFNRRRASR
jgi:hypothetical protein